MKYISPQLITADKFKLIEDSNDLRRDQEYDSTDSNLSLLSDASLGSLSVLESSICIVNESDYIWDSPMIDVSDVPHDGEISDMEYHENGFNNEQSSQYYPFTTSNYKFFDDDMVENLFTNYESEKFDDISEQLSIVDDVTTIPTNCEMKRDSITGITQTEIKAIKDGIQKFNITITYNQIKLINKIKSEFNPFEQIIQDAKYQIPNANPLKIHSDSHETKLNIYELSYILNLSQYHISLTRKIEADVLKTFTQYCDISLGNCTWLKSTDKHQRYHQIEFLFKIFNHIYPINKKTLEIIIKRGSYRRVQYKDRQRKRMKFTISHF